MMRKILLCLLVFAAAASTQISGKAQGARPTIASGHASWLGKAARSVTSAAGAILHR